MSLQSDHFDRHTPGATHLARRQAVHVVLAELTLIARIARIAASDCLATSVGVCGSASENAGGTTPRRRHTTESHGLSGPSLCETAAAMAASPTCRRSHSSVCRSFSLTTLTRCSMNVPGYHAHVVVDEDDRSGPGDGDGR